MHILIFFLHKQTHPCIIYNLSLGFDLPILSNKVTIILYLITHQEDRVKGKECIKPQQNFQVCLAAWTTPSHCQEIGSPILGPRKSK